MERKGPPTRLGRCKGTICSKLFSFSHEIYQHHPFSTSTFCPLRKNYSEWTYPCWFVVVLVCKGCVSSYPTSKETHSHPTHKAGTYKCRSRQKDVQQLNSRPNEPYKDRCHRTLYVRPLCYSTYNRRPSI